MAEGTLDIDISDTSESGGEIESDTGPPKGDLSAIPDTYDHFEKRGVALIFGHTTYDRSLKLPDRQGTSKDLERLSQVLESLNFHVIIREDQSKENVLGSLKEVADMDHSNNDCLMVFVMTHGNGIQLAANDQEYETSSLWEAFGPKKCRSLIGKPKLFFIQACRGKSIEKCVKIFHSGNTIDAALMRPPKVTAQYTIPRTADVLIMHASSDGKISWRNPDLGSWFIQALCRELAQHAQEKELLYILKGVSRNVAYSVEIGYEIKNEKGSVVKGKAKQMPTIVSTLTKDYYFYKKQMVNLALKNTCMTEMD